MIFNYKPENVNFTEFDSLNKIHWRTIWIY
jgi:hypothetical protein